MSVEIPMKLDGDTIRIEPLEDMNIENAIDEMLDKFNKMEKGQGKI